MDRRDRQEQGCERHCIRRSARTARLDRCRAEEETACQPACGLPPPQTPSRPKVDILPVDGGGVVVPGPRAGSKPRKHRKQRPGDQRFLQEAAKGEDSESKLEHTTQQVVALQTRDIPRTTALRPYGRGAGLATCNALLIVPVTPLQLSLHSRTSKVETSDLDCPAEQVAFCDAMRRSSNSTSRSRTDCPARLSARQRL